MRLDSYQKDAPLGVHSLEAVEFCLTLPPYSCRSAVVVVASTGLGAPGMLLATLRSGTALPYCTANCNVVQACTQWPCGHH